jgi:hypothetical protein
LWDSLIGNWGIEFGIGELAIADYSGIGRVTRVGGARFQAPGGDRQFPNNSQFPFDNSPINSPIPNQRIRNVRM